MTDFISIITFCALLGCIVGFLAGLLGIGGGLIIVPALCFLLVKFHVLTSDHVFVVAIATSLASIIFTSTSSAFAHHKNHNIPWDIAPAVLVGVAVGALLSGFLASFIPVQFLKSVFAISVVFIALRMMLSRPSKIVRTLPNRLILTTSTAVLGGVSGLIGIGGGALLVPFLTFFSVNMKKAIGCSAASGIVIAVFGTIGYVSSGLSTTNLDDGFVGFVYLPALFGIVVTSAIFAQLGAKATHYLPVGMIKKIFALLLVIVAIRMLFS
ncbi:sulfite exporter TauE/SafE family protein [Pseudoalteromonas tunicata]|uniref:Probable membrane transporter protein n=1 Tax=Pseudoalteromonas tunicata D2 TaxID=87626 RepID=A4C6J6_9GAMM|nr:sulfite exporter TauE/SafE family protein [Pseudoalteromonas tunicata]ATC95574.1 hypothetical protein PTUN_a3201 [Pseudoalteromonas tunicata]AXT31145.1 sulfite exporter TauE/SafE family protein [Pseudoalteromonas tunicata]EAR29600.1 hypothetical protein PTD2_12309 [Pseudoalteromonas tunicata D2]